MKKILIIGNGAHSLVIKSELEKIKNLKISGFIQINDTIHQNLKIKNFGQINNVSPDLLRRYYLLTAVGNNNLRQKIVKKLEKKCNKLKWFSFFSKKTTISEKFKIGKGSVILSNCFIGINVKINDHCIINSSCSIDHDSVFENFSSCGPGVVTGGNVKLKENSFVGIGSTVKNNIVIGKNSYIGGHSFVNKNTEHNTLYYGVPIKKIKKL